MLRCIRKDGSVTWQEQSERHAKFFVIHDLTHIAVEAVLRARLDERARGEPRTIKEFSAVRKLTEEELAAVRRMVNDLLDEWASIPVGGALLAERPEYTMEVCEPHKAPRRGKRRQARR